MSSYTSRLVVSLVDGVTAPARAVAASIAGIPKAMNKANGMPMTYSERLGKAIKDNNRALEEARGRMIDAAAGAFALRGAAISTVGSAMALEDKMADIAKVSGMSGDELKSFEGTLRNLARTGIPMAVEELAELAAAAAASGIANDDLEEFTKLTAKAAVAWGLNGAAAGDALAKIKTQLGLTVEETRNYADVINYLSDNSAAQAGPIIEFAKRVAASGKIAGFAEQEVLALGAAMISSGAEAEVAATTMRNVGRMLSRGDFGATKSQRDAFKLLGIDAEKVSKAMQIDASGTLMEVLTAISESEPHKKLALMSGIFGDEATALMPLLGELEKTRKQMRAVGDETNYLGSVQKEFEVRAQTGSYALQRFRNQIRDVGISMGQSLLPAMKEVLSVIGPILVSFGNWAQENPKVLATIMGVVGGVVALRVAMVSLSYLGLMGRGGVLGALSLGAKMLGGSVGYLWGAARGAVALQVALAGMSGGSVGILSRIAIGARGMLMAIPGMAGLAKAFGLVGVAIKAVGAIILANPIAASVAAIAGLAYLIYENWDAVGPYFTRMWEGIKGIFSGVAEWITGIVTLDFERAMGGLKTVLTSWDDIGQAMFDAGAALFTSLWDGMKSVWSSISGWAGGVASSITQPFKDAGSSVAGWFGYGDDSGGIDGARARGGPIRAGGTYLVGEEGPELITPSRNGHVHPNGSTFGGGGAQITQNLNVTISGATGDAQAMAREVAAYLERETRRLMNGVFADTGLRTVG